MTKCASHQANLVVQVAVVGGMIQDPVNQCDLTAACSRFFKHLLPVCVEDILFSLRAWSQQNLVAFLNLPDLISLQRLYGAATLPHDLLQELSPEGFHEGAGEAKSRALVTIIARHCFLAQERPVPTRFFLFSPCVS